MDTSPWLLLVSRQSTASKISNDSQLVFLHIKVLLLFSGSLDFTCEAYTFTYKYCNDIPMIKQIVNSIFIIFIRFLYLFPLPLKELINLSIISK